MDIYPLPGKALFAMGTFGAAFFSAGSAGGVIAANVGMDEKLGMACGQLLALTTAILMRTVPNRVSAAFMRVLRS